MGFMDSFILFLGCIPAGLIGLGARANPVSLAVSSDEFPSNQLSRRATPQYDVQGDNWGSVHDKQKRIDQAFYDAITLADAGYNYSKTGPIMNKYFKSNDGDKVNQVLQTFLGYPGQSHGDGPSWVGSEAFYHVFYVRHHFKQDKTGCGNYDKNLNVLPMAFSTDISQDRMNLNICDEALSYPLLSEVSCDTIADRTSGAMSSFGGLILNELLHLGIAFKPVLGNTIQNQRDDCGGFSPWGPFDNFNRASEACPEGQPLYNPDSYRWFVQEVWAALKCNNNDQPFQDPESNMDLWAIIGNCDGDKQCVPV